MKRYKQYLMEKTLTLDKDIEYLYEKSNVDLLLSSINAEDESGVRDFLNSGIKKQGNDYIFLDTDSSELVEGISQRANKLNPIDIRLGIFDQGSYYKPTENFLQISLNSDAFRLLQKANYSFDKVKEYMYERQMERFKSEFSIANFKGTIYHELTHWIEETFNDNMLSKRINKQNLKGKHNHVNHTEFEVNAQVHKIKQLKNDLGEDEFNSLTLRELFIKIPSLSNNFKYFRNENEYDLFVKRFVKRLDREDLLPTAFRNLPSWDKLREIISQI